MSYYVDVYFPISAWHGDLRGRKGMVQGGRQTGRRFTAFAEQNKPRWKFLGRWYAPEVNQLTGCKFRGKSET